MIKRIKLTTTIDMYKNLGIHWASSIPAFLALMCVPFPFLFYKYGEAIRLKCKFAAEAAAALERMRTVNQVEEEEGQDISEDDDRDAEKEEEKSEETRRQDKELESESSNEQGLDAGLRKR
jgi:hypothetical protein